MYDLKGFIRITNGYNMRYNDRSAFILFFNLDGLKKVNDTRQYNFEMSVSIGSSSYRAGEIKDLSELIELADQRMYQEKAKQEIRFQRKNRKNC